MSKCKYFQKENCIYDNKKILNCEDCFYQQLQQLKKENEVLKQVKNLNIRDFDKVKDLLEEAIEIIES